MGEWQVKSTVDEMLFVTQNMVPDKSNCIIKATEICTLGDRLTMYIHNMGMDVFVLSCLY